MILEVVRAVVGLVFLLGDISFVVTCSVLHFMRGGQEQGTVQGAFTLVLFFTAGLITNLFHFFRHEWLRMEQQSPAGKAKCFLLVFVPCSSLLRWYIGRCRAPGSVTRRCWTSTLRLLYCTGTLTQAVLQGFVVVHLWWAQEVKERDVIVTTVASVFFSLHAIYGVCGYIWTAYYDETHTNIPALDYALILTALTLNMGGRVAAMAVVMGTLGWYWLPVAGISPLLINYTVYIILAPSPKTVAQKVGLCFFLVPLAFLSAITVTERRILTIITTLAWLACSLPQIIMFHSAPSEWLVWVIPAFGQIIALLIMMVRWSAFEAAFERFGRLAQLNQFTKVPNKEVQLAFEPHRGSRA